MDCVPAELRAVSVLLQQRALPRHEERHGLQRVHAPDVRACAAAERRVELRRVRERRARLRLVVRTQVAHGLQQVSPLITCFALSQFPIFFSQTSCFFGYSNYCKP